MSKQLLHPEQAREKIARRFYQQHRQWLTGAGNWPWIMKLGAPVEADVNNHAENMLSWISAWQLWRGSGTLVWCEKRWRLIGNQRLPEKLILNNASEAAGWLGEHARWEKATLRYQHFITRWPALLRLLPRYFAILADYTDAALDRL